MNILSIIGALLIAVGGGIAYWQYTMMQGREIAEGKVIQLEPHPGSKGGTVYKIIAEFHDTAGQSHAYRSGFSSSSPGYKAGDKIRIFFDRNNPDDCGIMSFGYRFGAAWCLIIAGLALLLVNAGWHFGTQWMNENFPTKARY